MKMERNHERKMRDFKDEMNKKYQSELKISIETWRSNSPLLKKLSTLRKEKKITRGLENEKE